MTDLKRKTRIVVEGVELAVEQDQHSVTIRKVVGRDRKRKLDITNALTFSIRERDNVDPVAIALMHDLKTVAAWQTARCTCDYRYGYSDHAEHCQSIYVAIYDGARIDD